MLQRLTVAVKDTRPNSLGVHEAVTELSSWPPPLFLGYFYADSQIILSYDLLKWLIDEGVQTSGKHHDYPHYNLAK